MWGSFDNFVIYILHVFYLLFRNFVPGNQFLFMI